MSTDALLTREIQKVTDIVSDIILIIVAYQRNTAEEDRIQYAELQGQLDSIRDAMSKLQGEYYMNYAKNNAWLQSTDFSTV